MASLSGRTGYPSVRSFMPPPPPPVLFSQVFLPRPPSTLLLFHCIGRHQLHQYGTGPSASFFLGTCAPPFREFAPVRPIVRGEAQALFPYTLP